MGDLPPTLVCGGGVDRWDTGLVDITGAGGLLVQVNGRAAQPVIEWLAPRVGGHEKLPTGGHENAHSRPLRTAHRRTRKCPLAAMNLPRPT